MALTLNSTYIRPVICLALGLAALVVVCLIGQDQIRKGSVNKWRNFKTGNAEEQRLQRFSGEYADDLEKSISQTLIRNIQGENIRKNLRELAKHPHTAGTQANYRVAEWIRDQWRSQGLQDVHFTEYDVLLSHPADYNRPNTVELLDNKGRLIFRAVGQQPPLVPAEQSDFGANLTWNAYSASGTALGELVYANYGRKEDYDVLQEQNISVKGKIVMVRYGKEWRGAKALEAQTHGAAGLVIYSDPAESCPNITEDGEKYPHSVWMPKSGVQLGSLLNYEGDPLSPLYPALDYIYRSKTIDDLQKENIIPSIPVQPMSYGDAYQFLSRMKGKTAPSDWQGGLNITYKMDPGSGANLRVRLTVRTNTTRGKVRNVIGFIEGSREPDRYVILGNHFDAWIYGAIDPNSGTATILEISRSFMRLINETGWRPLRTIVFCAWDGEEYSLLGSNEWVEQYATILDRRGVAYLNVDLISGNETMSADGNPILYGVAVKAAKRVKNPNKQEIAAGRKSLFDTWLRKVPPYIIPDIPKIPAPGGGSDHVPFFRYIGMPVLDFRYRNLTVDGSYPLYHTLYETPFVEEKLSDPNNFAFHVATGQFWAEMARLLADNSLLPLNVDDYANVLKTHIADLNQTLINVGLLPKMNELQKDMDSLKYAAEKMLTRAEKFHYYADQIGHRAAEPTALEAFNSRLQQVERCFVNPRGGPGLPEQRHVVYGIDTEDAYAANSLPLVYRQISNYVKAHNETEKIKAFNALREQISIVHYSVDCVTNLLKKIPAIGN